MNTVVITRKTVCVNSNFSVYKRDWRWYILIYSEKEFWFYMYEYVFYFVIYAFLGWCTEVVYKAVTVGQFVNRGFLNGPVCPIYGFGMVFVIWALTPVTDNAFFCLWVVLSLQRCLNGLRALYSKSCFTPNGGTIQASLLILAVTFASNFQFCGLLRACL